MQFFFLFFSLVFFSINCVFMLKIKTFILLNCPLIKFENLIKTFNPQDHLNRRNNKLEKHTTKQHMQGCNKRSLMTKIKREKKKKPYNPQ